MDTEATSERRAPSMSAIACSLSGKVRASALSAIVNNHRARRACRLWNRVQAEIRDASASCA